MRYALNIFLAVMTIGTLFVTNTAFAQETVEFEVRTILATKVVASTDPAVGDLEEKLKLGFASYQSFKQISTETIRLSAKTKRTLLLPNNQKISVGLHGVKGKLVKVGLSVAERMRTTVRIARGTTHLQNGLVHPDGVLILAITIK